MHVPRAPSCTQAGGEWHVEGLHDERIVATACVYLESENVGEITLEFRTEIKEAKNTGDDFCTPRLETEDGRVTLNNGVEWIAGFKGNDSIYGLTDELVQP